MSLPHQPTSSSHLRRVAVATSLLLAVLSAVVAVAAPAAAAPIVIRPNGDVVRQWTGTPGSAWAAIDDPVVQPTAVPADYFIYGSAAGRTTEVTMSSAQLGGGTARGAVWFFANTGTTTRLRVEVITLGTVHATTTVAAGGGFAWRSLALPDVNQARLDDLRIRFTVLDGGNSNVRAAYLELTSLQPPPPPPFVQHIANLDFYEGNNLTQTLLCRVPVMLSDLASGRQVNFPAGQFGCDNDEARSVRVELLGYHPTFVMQIYNDSACVSPPDSAHILVPGRNANAEYPRYLSYDSFEVDGDGLTYRHHDGALDGKVSCLYFGYNARSEPADPERAVQAGVWKRAIEQWGVELNLIPPIPLPLSKKWSVDLFTTQGQAVRGEYKCYTDGVRTGGGPLPAVVTVKSFPYGECWVKSPADGYFTKRPVSG
ncbi:hypothetical protein ACTMSW_09320 [Micromonospora sp. BQ11]|uniref:hypothetical protein n=1 Tax=Micromonospora sp. BQ11 TaxID=3452212 RepID=UPI003F88CD65